MLGDTCFQQLPGVFYSGEAVAGRVAGAAGGPGWGGLGGGRGAPAHRGPRPGPHPRARSTPPEAQDPKLSEASVAGETRGAGAGLERRADPEHSRVRAAFSVNTTENAAPKRILVPAGLVGCRVS